MWSSSPSCMCHDSIPSFLRSAPCDHSRRKLVHPDLDPICLAALGEEAVNPRILVRILDLVPAFFRALVNALVVEVPRHLSLRAAPADGQVSSRPRPRVEGLVPPRPRRHEHRTRLPGNLVKCLVLVRPHQRVALTLQDDDMRAGAMTGGFLVCADLALGD